jgi:hypothetical protein
MNTPIMLDAKRVGRWQLGVIVAGSAALLGCIAGAIIAPAHFFQVYLISYLFLLGVTLGGMALLMIHRLTGGAWGLLVRRVLEAQMKTLPLMALLFLPIVFGLPHLYAWAVPPITVGAGLARFKGVYLEPQFFLWRAAAYFACWLLLALALTWFSRRQERTGNVRDAWMCMNLSGPGLVAYGVSLHFAAIDWVMSVQPGFHSTIFGPLIAAGQLLSGLACCLVIFAWLVAPRLKTHEAYSVKAVNDLGGLLFTLVIVWAYMVWFQFMLVWMANLRAGGVWYVVRARGVWPWVALAVFALHFVVPFFLLLLRAVKQNPKFVAGVASLLLTMQLVYMYYQVLPSYASAPLWQGWIDACVMLFLGGAWLALFLQFLKSAPLLPAHDVSLPQAIRLRKLDEEEAARKRRFVAERGAT